MSQITSCPSCGTRFRVVADQLRISDGWVRCGQCQEVFDARLHMDDAQPPVPVPQSSVPAPAAVPAAAFAPSGTAHAPAAASSHLPERVQPVAATAEPATSTTPAPGYELPAPHLGEDIDFSQYQSAEPAAQGGLTERLPLEIDLDRHLTAAPAVDDPWTAEPVASPLPPSPAAADTRTDPAWETASVPAPDAASRGGFPSLDLSVLQVSAPAPAAPLAAPSMQPADLQENGLESPLHTRDALHKDEQLSWPTGLSNHADVAAPEPSEEAAAAVAEPALDALESAAQKLAQADPSAAEIPPPWPADHAAMPDHEALSAEAQGLDSSLEPSFVREARRKAWWQKPVVRVAMGAGVVVLPVALALQVALHERNALVAWQPGVRPALEFMCTALQCQLAPRQQIAAMVVSGSTFTQGTQDRSYLLNLSIQNRARTPVGMPAVELTLTDAQDQVIARKAILPKELGAPAELKAGAEWSGAVPVSTQGLNLQVSGYRVLLFYP